MYKNRLSLLFYCNHFADFLGNTCTWQTVYNKKMMTKQHSQWQTWFRSTYISTEIPTINALNVINIMHWTLRTNTIKYTNHNKQHHSPKWHEANCITINCSSYITLHCCITNSTSHFNFHSVSTFVKQTQHCKA